MNDIFQTKVLCPKCNKETKDISLDENGFKIRAKECPKCGKTYPHPGDMKDYEQFKQLKKREFDVKLRRVGNSHSITIPREILDFERHFQEMEKEMNKMIRLSLERPGRIILKFRRIK